MGIVRKRRTPQGQRAPRYRAPDKMSWVDWCVWNGEAYCSSLALGMRGSSNSDEGLPPLLSCRLIQKQRCLDCKWAEGLENHWALRLHLLSPLETVHAQGIVLKVLTCPKKINIGGTPPCIHVLTHVTLQFLPPKAECTFLTPDFGCRHLTWLGQLNVSRYNVIHLAARNVELKENI